MLRNEEAQKRLKDSTLLYQMLLCSKACEFSICGIPQQSKLYLMLDLVFWYGTNGNVKWHQRLNGSLKRVGSQVLDMQECLPVAGKEGRESFFATPKVRSWQVDGFNVTAKEVDGFFN